MTRRHSISDLTFAEVSKIKLYITAWCIIQNASKCKLTCAMLKTLIDKYLLHLNS